MTVVDAYDRKLDRSISQATVIADLRYKEKERKRRFGEIDEKITRDEYLRVYIRLVTNFKVVSHECSNPINTVAGA